MNETASAGKPVAPSWPAAAASLVLTATTLYLFRIYGELHWRVVFSAERYESGLSERMQAELLDVLAALNYYRVFGALALLFAVWSFRGRPRWPAWLALAASGPAGRPGWRWPRPASRCSFQPSSCKRNSSGLGKGGGCILYAVVCTSSTREAPV